MRLILSVVTLIFLNTSLATAYYAEVYPLSEKTPKPLFILQINEKTVGATRVIDVEFQSDGKVQLIEKASVDIATGELIQYEITQVQTGEKGFVEVTGNKIKIKYDEPGSLQKLIELAKPKYLVAPGNFDPWLKAHFDLLKKEKNVVIDFLLWDRLETIKFKVSYLGLTELNKIKTHKFKMNVDNFFIAAFISPIIISVSEDMKQILRYQGRVAVKQKVGSGLKDLDADVIYFY